MNMTTENYILMSIILAISPTLSMFLMSALDLQNNKEKEFLYTLITILILCFNLALIYKIIQL